MIDSRTLARHAPRLHALALRMDPINGQDLAQDALMRAWRHRDQFRDGCDPAPWLRTILVRCFLSRCSSERTRAEAYHRLADTVRATHVPSAAGMSQASVDASKSCAAVQHGCDLSVLRTKIETALSRISDDHERMIRIVDLGGATYREAADKIGCPMGTVMSGLHRARRAASAELRAINAEMQ